MGKNRYNVPQDKRRACLCRDRDTYSRECCEGDYINQGIGSITKDETCLLYTSPSPRD